MPSKCDCNVERSLGGRHRSDCPCYEFGGRINDEVNSPSHYTNGRIEVIEFIEDKKLGFHLGNAVKYIVRAGHKDPSKHVQDLQKARWYLDREITRIQEEEEDCRPGPGSC
jgi:hypothetical protein